jgi:predicted metalloprotease with PDZ domain
MVRSQPMRVRSSIALVGLVVLVVLPMALAARAAAQAPIAYRVAFPAPEHHYAIVEVTFPNLPAGPLDARMSRSSPGRYALHEYAKNVFELQAFDGAGKALPVSRPNPYQWTVSGHDGTVRIAYKIYGDHVDGTYLAIDPTHAHLNMPATVLWARGLEGRAVRLTFDPPKGLGWVPATQLFPTDDPWTFTAPNLQYLMDSPTELSTQTIRTFTVRAPDGKAATIRVALHHDAGDAEVNEYVAGTEKIVKEHAAVFGELPAFEPGSYTFLGDYVPWGGGDGMEHRNSTVVAAAVSLRSPGSVLDVLDTVAHEFFHAWNVERIRPKSLEPFNFEEANISGELWLAEGFTQYYGELVMGRSGLQTAERTATALGRVAGAVVNLPGRRFRSAVAMSEMAPFTDAARSVDKTNFSTTFISYYTYGSAIALGLDLTLRDRSNGKISLDDYMRAMWRVHGKPGGAQPGLVARPYTLKDARDRLAEVSGDRVFADNFFDRFVEGREMVDYAPLLLRAGFLFRKRNPGGAWIGQVPVDTNGTITNLVPWGTPAFEAGLDQGDVIVTVDGKPMAGGALQAALKARKPGDRLTITFKRRGGATGTATITMKEDPGLETVAIESTGAALTAEQRAFRHAWLGSKVTTR